MPILECGSEAAAVEFRQHGGSFAAALQGASRISMVLATAGGLSARS
jgi:hypothetical protein